MVDIDNRNIDRDEERRVQQKQNENRRDVEKRMREQPMKTFEAKLAEKAAHEVTTKESALRQHHDEKKTKEEQESLLDKIIGTAKEKEGETEQSRVVAVHKELEQEFEKKRDGRLDRSDFEKTQTDKEKGVDTADSKKGEYSAEGHKRVAEKTEDQGGRGSGGSGGDARDGGGSQQQGFGTGGQSQREGQGQAGQFKKAGSSFLSRVNAVNRAGGQSYGFQQNARVFTDENLDEMVTKVQIGINEQGQEEFSVELSDAYFDGLKVTASRTENGVVLKFHCPNVGVRSTFLKFRPQVYARFKEKKVSVCRIDIV